MKPNKMQIPDAVGAAMRALKREGYEVYLIGGCVRDHLMHMRPHDFDLTTDATPEEMMSVFADYKVIETGIRHGTLTVIVNSMPIEITTYRVDGAYEDNRHPTSVSFTRNLREDAARRDFTMNAIAMDVDGNLRDSFDGCADIKARMIRAVGDPDVRFEEDALRILRGLRFAAVLGFEIEEQTSAALRRKAALLRSISAERVREELFKLICGRYARQIIAKYTDVLGVVLPELLPMHGFDQKNRHHCYDVLTHSLIAMENLAPKPYLRLAGLFHDVGKPSVFTQDESGEGHFYGHAEKSEEICGAILSRLKVDNLTKTRVLTLVKYHDVPIAAEEKSVRRYLAKLGEENLFDLCLLKRADNLAQGEQWRYRQSEIDALEACIRKVVADGDCFSMKSMALCGADLIALGVPPGKRLGELLKIAFEAVLDGTCENNREELIKLLKEKREL